MNVLKIAIIGPQGRMGQVLIQTIFDNPKFQLTAAIAPPSSKLIGKDAGNHLGIQTNVLVNANLKALDVQKIDVFIDFSTPKASLEYLQFCVEKNIDYVLGTTGFNDEEKQLIETAAQKIGIVFAPNFSIAMNLLFSLVKTAANKLDDAYDVEIIEAHHRHKKDAPSGTALKIGEIIANEKKRNLDAVATYGRRGLNEERNPKTIGFSTVRAGDIIGDHTALFATEGERLEITHKASSRTAFALGALKAAWWLKETTKIGLYDMQNVLGLKHK